MDYKNLLDSVRNAGKDDLKKIVFEMDQTYLKKLDDMFLQEDTRRELFLMFKDRAFFEMLLVNALAKSDV